MSNVIFKEVLIVDEKMKSAKKVVFDTRCNVVTSRKNHVGKSCLLKSLYYTLGAEVEFDEIWRQTEKAFFLKIEVNGIGYRVCRYGNNTAFFDATDNVIKTFTHISKGLPEYLIDLFDFAIYLKDKHDTYRAAAPFCWYLPYYIDQIKGWTTSSFNSFANAEQYAKEQRRKALLFHLGTYSRETIGIEKEIAELKGEIKATESEHQELLQHSSALHAEVKSLLPLSSPHEYESKFSTEISLIKTHASKLGEARKLLMELQSRIVQCESVLNSTKQGNREDDNLEFGASVYCQKCGHLVNELLMSKLRDIYVSHSTSYIRQQMKVALAALRTEFEEAKKRYADESAKIRLIAPSEEESVEGSFTYYLRYMGLKNVIAKKDIDAAEKAHKVSQLEGKMKGAKQRLKELINTERINKIYSNRVESLLEELGAWDETYRSKISIGKELASPGSLSSKIVLAQHMAFFWTMYELKIDTLLMPFVVDSPRTFEASEESSRKMLNMIVNAGCFKQTILATVDYESFNVETNKPIKIIYLDSEKALLQKEDYLSNLAEIDDLLTKMQTALLFANNK